MNVEWHYEPLAVRSSSFAILDSPFAILPSPLGACAPALLLEEISLVDPDLDPDDAVGRVRLRDAVVDVRLQRVERQPPFLIPLGAGDLGAAQAAADHDLHALGAEAEGRLHGLLHRPAEGDAPLELAGDGLRDQLGVELRPLDFLDVDVDLAAHPLLQIVPQLVHLGAPAADDDARPRGVDGDAQLVGGPLDVDLRHSGVAEASLQLAAQLQILVQGGGVVRVAVPARMPGLVVYEPEPIRVRFLTHVRILLSYFLPSPLRVSSLIVMWLCRRRTRNARPIGAGRTRFAIGPPSTKISFTYKRS